jgi:hypothetical protein
MQQLTERKTWLFSKGRDTLTVTYCPEHSAIDMVSTYLPEEIGANVYAHLDAFPVPEGQTGIAVVALIVEGLTNDEWILREELTGEEAQTETGHIKMQVYLGTVSSPAVIP